MLMVKKDLTSVKDFHNVILKLKTPIMKKLSFSHNPSHLNVVNTIHHDIIKDKVFSDEMIRIYNNILSNKLDNDNIDNNNNDVNTNHLVLNGRKSLKRKCNDEVQPIEQKSRTKNTLICENSNKKKKKKINNDIMIEKDKLNDKKKISVFVKNTSMNKNNNNNKNTKNIDDDVTSVIEYDGTIKKVFAKSMSGELLIVI